MSSAGVYSTDASFFAVKRTTSSVGTATTESKIRSSPLILYWKILLTVSADVLEIREEQVR